MIDDEQYSKMEPGYYECIVETGFYCYFLIRHYLELDLFDADIGKFLKLFSKKFLNRYEKRYGRICEYVRRRLEFKEKRIICYNVQWRHWCGS